MRFHVALSFLPTDQIVPLAVACDRLGYDGVYLSDHLFNPEKLASRYTYSPEPDGSPGWPKETEWPDPMCVFSGLSTVTEHLTFTTGVYVAPMRDLITVAKTVATTAVLSHDRVRLGIGVGWCREEYEQTGQSFADRGKRLDEMIGALRALWAGGSVEFHGEHYDVPACQINPSPSCGVPILGGGHSGPALRRAATLCDGWIAAGAYSEEEASGHLDDLDRARREAGNDESGYLVYLSLAERPNRDLYQRFEDRGVTDIVCAPWMGVPVGDADSGDAALAARIAACERFAEQILARVR